MFIFWAVFNKTIQLGTSKLCLSFLQTTIDLQGVQVTNGKESEENLKDRIHRTVAYIKLMGLQRGTQHPQSDPNGSPYKK